ncbi:MAG TPA: hypothetical protein VFY07_04540, partial [Geomobilimonas sp.]|nr:hypothetical protein [Geomobilimonas sp.]
MDLRLPKTVFPQALPHAISCCPESDVFSPGPPGILVFSELVIAPCVCPDGIVIWALFVASGV